MMIVQDQDSEGSLSVEKRFDFLLDEWLLTFDTFSVSVVSWKYGIVVTLITCVGSAWESNRTRPLSLPINNTPQE